MNNALFSLTHHPIFTPFFGIPFFKMSTQWSALEVLDLDGGAPRERIPLCKESVRIGRTSGDIKFDFPWVSAHHCTITKGIDEQARLHASHRAPQPALGAARRRVPSFA